MSWSFTGYIGALTLSVLGRGKDESKHFLYLYSQFGTHLWMTGWRRFPVVNPLKTLWHSFHLRLTAFCLCLPLSPWDAAHEDSLVDQLGIDSGNGSCLLVQAFQGLWQIVPHSALVSILRNFSLICHMKVGRLGKLDPILIAIGWPNMCQDLIPLSGIRFYYWVVFPGLLLPQQQNRLSSHGQTSPLVKLLSSFIAYISW